MTDQKHQPTDEEGITRRLALTGLGTSSSRPKLRIRRSLAQHDLTRLGYITHALLRTIRLETPTKRDIKMFFAEVQASVSTCWALLKKNDGLKHVGLAVPSYAPALVNLLEQYPQYRQKQSYAVAQASLLLSIVDHHRLHFAERVVHCQDAVKYARQSGEVVLLVTCLTALGEALLTNEQPEASVDTLLEAERYKESKQMTGFLRNKVLLGLSLAYAKQGKAEQAVQYLKEAYTVFTAPKKKPPLFLSMTHGVFNIILLSGSISLALGDYQQAHGHTDAADEYYQDAAKKLAAIEALPPHVVIPELIRVEILNQRALAAAKAGDLDDFLQFLEAGALGSHALNSKKLIKNAEDAYKVGADRWSEEESVDDLRGIVRWGEIVYQIRQYKPFHLP